MLFTSPKFLVFFSLFFGLYWFVFRKHLKAQNWLILGASYFFYAVWDWRFLIILMVTSLVSYSLGLAIDRSTHQKRRKALVLLGLLLAIGQLAIFKYFNFFIDSFNALISGLHLMGQFDILNLFIPIGISYYTFRVVSYLLDINNGKIKPTSDWLIYFNYVSFFPSLISGPIDKAGLLIPQLEQERNFDPELARMGMQQVLWGFFKKIVIANNCAEITGQIFANYSEMSASTLLLGLFLFTIQLYTDFSGYSDMAIGFARLIGFKITKNFDFPFFAQNIAEFWRKWHISLTSWLTEYVFTPLNIAFRDYGNRGIILSIVINFMIIGLWHGANWTYLVFGLIHGCFYIPMILKGTMFKRKKIKKGRLLPTTKEFFNMVGTFFLLMITLILFKSPTITDAYHYFSQLFSLSLFSVPSILPFGLILLIVFLLTVEWFGKAGEYALDQLTLPKVVRWLFYVLMVVCVFLNAGKQQEFVYFQF